MDGRREGEITGRRERNRGVKGRTEGGIEGYRREEKEG